MRDQNHIIHQSNGCHEQIHIFYNVRIKGVARPRASSRPPNQDVAALLQIRSSGAGMGPG